MIFYITYITPEDIAVGARTVAGEARGEEMPGQVAVAHVLLNRAIQKTGQFRRDASISEACIRDKQFSCWNDNDPNRKIIQSLNFNHRAYRTAHIAMLQAINEAEHGEDPTNGSLHYHTTQVQPYWAEGHEPVAFIGSHLFYNDVD